MEQLYVLEEIIKTPRKLKTIFSLDLIVCNDKKVHLYEKKYYEILGALKKNGLFIYTPSLISVEQKVDTKKYSIKRYKNAEDRELDTVIITRL